MIETLLQPFQFPFMQNAFWIALIVAPPTALLSCFLVLKGWALMGDAVSHAVLPGIVLAYMAGLPLLLGAFVAGLGSALLTGWLADNSRIKRDTVMGVVFSSMFALGIVLHTAFPTDVHLDHILFGNMLGVECALPDNAAALLWGDDADLLSGAATLWRECSDILTAAAIAIPVTLILALKWRDLMLHAFDPAQAQVSGLPTKLLHYGLLTILSLTIVATLTSVGLILAIGLLIAPGAIAFLLTRRFGAMLITATLVCLLAMVTGIWASFHLDSAPAPTIILILTGVFLLAFLRRVILTRRV
jgi:manganese/iron transport system permease protein